MGWRGVKCVIESVGISPERAKEFSKGCNPLIESLHHTIEP